MIPIRLKLEGFLTFRDALEINFEELYDEGIFLVSGPTGSGKTSIFDAISYALYGESPTSGRKNAKELRSHLIPEDGTMEVSYEFYAGDRRYFIRRWQKGIGKTPNQRLIIDGDEENALTKAGEIKNEVTEVLGLSADQFTKIVMLPQGEFQNFLVASSKEKSEILRKLFNTEHYARIRYLIKDKLDAVDSQVKNYETIIDREKGISEKASQAIAPLEILGILSEEHEEAFQTHEKLEAELKLMGKNLENLGLKLDSAEKLNEAFEKKEKLEKTLEEALQDEPKFRQDEEKAAKLNQIRPLADGYLRLLRDRSQLADLEEKKISLEGRLKQETEKLDQATADQEMNPPRREKILELTGRNSKVSEVLEELDHLEQQKKDLSKTSNSVLDLKAKLDRQVASQEEIKELKEKVSEESTLERTLLTRQMERKDQIRENKSELAVLKEYAELQKKLKENREGESKNKDKIETLKAEYQAFETELEQLKDIAEKQGLAQYAHLLQEGAPCPLCGSDHHPTIFHLDSQVEKSQLNAAEKNLSARKEEIISLTNRLEFLEEGFQELWKKIQGVEEEYGREVLLKDPLSLEEAVKKDEQHLLTLGDELKQCRQRSLQHNDRIQSLLKELLGFEGLQEEYDKKKEAESILRSKVQDLEGKVQGQDKEILKKEKKENEDRLNQLKEAILAADTEFQSKKEEVTQLFTSLKSIKEDISGRKDQLLQDEASFKEHLAALALSLEEFLGLEKDLHLEESLKQGAADYFKGIEKTRNELKFLSDTLAGEERKDLAALNEELKEMKTASDKMRADCNQAIRRENSLSTALARVKEAVSALEPLKGELETARRLDNTTGRGTTFENYVLGYYLDGVLMNANTRLRNMTANRFSLVRQAKDSGDRRMIEGLDINVFDTYSNTERDVKTLSGGESFKASLSMALGLSDFIQESKTGIRLDTIFIDEGFGTLDQESLDSAMETILEIQDHGRLVGIISHVEELKERIPTQILVQNNGASGSSVKIRKII